MARWEFRVLGSVEAWAGEDRLDLGHAKQRCVLAALLWDAGRVVPTDQLIDRVWGERPPSSVRSVLYGYVAGLRTALRAADAEADGVRLARRSGGYALETGPGTVDVHRFRSLVARARGTGEHEARAGLLQEALRLCRGDPFTGLSGAWVEAVRVGLGGERMAALLERLDTELLLGRHTGVLTELRALAQTHPLDERVVGQLMVALYRCRRQAEALEQYERTRQRLSEELGIDPGAELRALHQQILRNTLDLAGSATTQADQREHSGPRLVPAELPRAVPGFSGRTAALARLDALARAEAQALHGGPVVICGGASVSAIAGSAGVGKTALAVHWAHRVREEFPDGQLYVNLRGFDREREPLRARDALGQLLRGLGLTPQEIPMDEEEQARRYRSLLADRRMLILLDDAASAGQVRPLLPGGRSCFVVVTSRNRLGGLIAHEGAHPLLLDVLSPAEAHELLVAVLGGTRVTAEPEAAAELARLCGFLPLALRLAAARLVCEPGQRLAGLAAELAEGSRLAKLEVEDDERSAIRAALALSYRALDEASAGLFRLLGLVPGPDFEKGAAAALADTDPEEAARLLDALAAAHLVSVRGEGRYHFHDLLREYALERCRAGESEAVREAARERLFAWYLHTADSAARILYPQIPRLPREETVPVCHPVPLADEVEAVIRLEEERAGLLAAVEHTARYGPRPLSWQLLDALLGYLWLCVPRGIWRVAAQTALDAAAAEGDRRGEAAMYYSIGYALWDTGRLGTAAEHHRHAVELHRRVGWPPGEAAALGGLGFVEWETAELDAALEHFSGALAIVRAHGQSDAEALALIGVGLVCRDLGRLREASRHLELSLSIRRKAGVRYEANHLDNLGLVYWERGLLEEAETVLREALAINEEVGYRNGHAFTLVVLGRVHLDSARRHEALDHGERALRLARDTGNGRIQADALNLVADAHRALGRAGQSAEHHALALRAARTAHNRRAEADSLLGLAAAHRALGSPDEALAHAREAHALAADCGFRVVEGQALAELAETEAASGEPGAAHAHAGEALALQERTGHRLGAERALTLLRRTEQ